MWWGVSVDYYHYFCVDIGNKIIINYGIFKGV